MLHVRAGGSTYESRFERFARRTTPKCVDGPWWSDPAHPHCVLTVQLRAADIRWEIGGFRKRRSYIYNVLM